MLSDFNELFKEAKKDFPDLKENQVIVSNGKTTRRGPGHGSIRFEWALSEIPNSYTKKQK